MKTPVILILFFAIVTMGCHSKTNQKSENIFSNLGVASGEVQETMNSGGYTYIKVKDTWFAGPLADVKVGDKVSIHPSMDMTDFYSSTLDRNFDKIYFVDGVMNGYDSGDNGTAKWLHALSTQGAVNPSRTKAIEINKLENGTTVAEIFRNSKALEGKEVKLRGKVVKFTGEIMDTNWLHIQDGTDFEGAYDLTVTTDKTAGIGDQIVVTGKVATNKDFGYGYTYNVIIEDADIRIEP